MLRKEFWLVLAALVLLATPGEAKRRERVTVKDPGFSHVVIFQLKKDAPSNAAEGMITDCRTMLTTIPTVRSLKVGRPSEKSTSIASKDYQVGLLVMFDDYDGLKTYLDHEKHQEFVKKHDKEFDKVLVYDFANQEK
jgi:hypothetical protein